MIASIKGQVVHQDIDHLVILVGGSIGLRVYVPRTVFDTFDGPGHMIQLATHLDVKEDSLTLYGFADEEERAVFETLNNISGVGPKLAINILSTLSTQQLRNSIAQGDSELLTRVPGIGKKKAEKIAFELKDKLTISGPAELAGLYDVDTDVLDALVALGYSIVEAQAAIQTIPRDAPDSIEERVLIALSYFT
ncbi:MAG: Holliday junction branch migration protein RuvA [Anaerolineae bacterium]|nr:Holliday junction branch migration protein RuvA [Anaerolineae bacterium]